MERKFLYPIQRSTSLCVACLGYMHDISVYVRDNGGILRNDIRYTLQYGSER
jgi:hypothetical protein